MHDYAIHRGAQGAETGKLGELKMEREVQIKDQMGSPKKLLLSGTLKGGGGG